MTVSIEYVMYSLRSQAEEAGKLWESRGNEFSAKDIEEAQRTIVALGQIVRDTANRRAAA